MHRETSAVQLSVFVQCTVCFIPSITNIQDVLEEFEIQGHASWL